jgi:hypothetical protein
MHQRDSDGIGIDISGYRDHPAGRGALGERDGWEKDEEERTARGRHSMKVRSYTRHGMRYTDSILPWKIRESLGRYDKAEYARQMMAPQ